MSFRKILDIDDLNFILRIAKNELQKSVSITPENIYKIFFQIEKRESSILAKNIYQTHGKKLN